MEDTIKVLVVDDASVMRRAVVDTLSSDPMIEVIDTAENGLIGLEKALRLQPDVITLDMDMPVMNGISAIRHIMIKCQIPIVVLSSLFTDGTITFEALRLGVVDFVPKPSGAVSRDLTKGKEMIIDRVQWLAKPGFSWTFDGCAQYRPAHCQRHPHKTHHCQPFPGDSRLLPCHSSGDDTGAQQSPALCL